MFYLLTLFFVLLSTTVSIVHSKRTNETIDDFDDRVHYTDAPNTNGTWIHDNQSVHAYNNTQSMVSTFGM